MSLDRFCRRTVVTARPEQSVAEVARLMRDEHVGAVVIVTVASEPIGIVTDRDLVIRVLAEEEALAVSVETIMTPDPVMLRRDARVDDVVASMRAAGVRRIPIVDLTGTLCGMVSLDDLNVLFAGELSASMAAVQDNRGP
jgi:CBS domain-containing protein